LWHEVARGCTATFTRPLGWVPHFTDISSACPLVCILNKLRRQLQVVAVKAPGFGDNRKSILWDLVILTGRTVFTDVPDIKLKHAALDMLGSTGSITITKEDAIVLNGQGSKDSTQPMFMIIHPASQVIHILSCYS